MKKTLLLFGMAAMVAFAFTACGSDGDETPAPSALPTPVYASTATSFEIDDNLTSTDNTASLKGLNFTESGKAIIEVATVNGTKYVTYDVKIENGTYTITKAGKAMGTVKGFTTRSEVEGSLTIDITVEIPGLGSFTFTTDNPVNVTKVTEAIAATGNTEKLARTWKVTQMKLTCEGDISVSKTENSGNLKVFADEAQARGANLTDDEMDKLNKSISGLTLDKTGMFSIEYYDNVAKSSESEACTWQWTDANQDKLMLKLRDSEFGNKFLNSDSHISVNFNASGCTFTLTTDIKGSKNYLATLTIVLK